MNTYTKPVLLILAFLVGVGVGVGAYRLHVFDQASAEAKGRWFVCTRVHEAALQERANLFRQKFTRWPTNVQELVEAHFLPEFSEVHFCPSQVSELTRADYHDDDFVDQNHTGFVAYYASSPYRFRIEGSNFTVICSFDKEHTR